MAREYRIRCGRAIPGLASALATLLTTLVAPTLVASTLVASTLVARTLGAQGMSCDSARVRAAFAVPSPSLASRTPSALQVSLAVTAVGFVALDRAAREALRDRTPGVNDGALDALANAVGPLGTARVVVPTLAGTWLVASITRQHAVADAVARIGVGYVLADVTESLLKGAVGRERPHVAGRPYYFDPFTNDGDEHSFPSAHVTHAMAVAAGIAREVPNPWAGAVAYVVAGTVGWQRLHEDQHWLSDVGGASAIAIGAQHAVGTWHERHQQHLRVGERAPHAPRASLLVAPNGVVLIHLQ